MSQSFSCDFVSHLFIYFVFIASMTKENRLVDDHRGLKFVVGEKVVEACSALFLGF